jgi:hypothetical protein
MANLLKTTLGKNEVLGLLLEINVGELTPGLAGAAYEFTMDMVPTEWNQWLIIEKR